jgi:thermitase
VIKRIAAVVSAAGLIAVAMFAGGVFAGASVAAVSDVSVVSSADEQSGTVSEAAIEEPPTTDLAATAAEYDAIAGRWGIERIAVSSAWDAVDGFGPVLVAVLDTGIASDAPFADRIVGNIDFSGEGNVEDAHGHGTHMAGTIAAIAPNASFLNVKVADKRGRCDTAAVAKAIRWATDNGAQVINVSLEVAPSADLDNAVRYAWEHGAIVVAAAGNSGSSAPAYPAAYPEAMAVAGTNQADGLAVLSNHGDWVDIAAPGFKIYAERPGAEFGYETGTSPAAAHVSGVAALLFGIATDTSGDGLLNSEVRDTIESSAQPLTTAGTGSGLVDALSAVLALAA